MEYIPVQGEKEIIQSSTLNSRIGKNIKHRTWFKICREMVNVLDYSHKKVILHNYLHWKNIRQILILHVILILVRLHSLNMLPRTIQSRLTTVHSR